MIFDFVEEEPNWKVGPLFLGQGGRLLNVAVTRAQHRLFVVGNILHVRRLLKKTLLSKLVAYASELQLVRAEEFMRSDFHRAVAEAVARIRHGEVVDLNTDRLRLLSERDFFAALDFDLRGLGDVSLSSPHSSDTGLKTSSHGFERSAATSMFT